MFIKFLIFLLIIFLLSDSLLYSQAKLKTKKQEQQEIIITQPDTSESAQKKKIAEKARLLEIVGSMSSTNLYMAYVSLTLLKNEIDNGLSSDYHERILQSLKSTLNLLKDNLAEMKKEVILSGSDKGYVEQLENSFTVLLEDSELLFVYFKSKAKPDNDNFMNQHRQAWEILQKIMGQTENKK